MKTLHARPDLITGNRGSPGFRTIRAGRSPRAEAAGIQPASRKQRRERGSTAGFTLIELMVVVGVLVLLGILASSVLMDSAGWLAHYRLRSAAKSIAMVFQAAKMEAIKSNMACAVAFGQALDDGIQYDGVAFVDANNNLNYDSDGNGAYNPSGDERVLKRLDISFYKGVQFDSAKGGGSGLTFAVNGDGKPAIAFNSRGLPRDGSGTPGGGSAFLVNDHGSRLSIVVNTTGSIRIEKN